MDAYAIFAGGGVRGAALAGALHIAQTKGVRFIGYGGTSAGAIVALLACVGYTGEDIGKILIEKEFSEFIADGGKEIENAKKRFASLSKKSRFFNPLKVASDWQAASDLFGKLVKSYGFMDNAPLRVFLTEKVKEKLPSLKKKAVIEFKDLEDEKCPPLKVIASNITLRTPVIFEAHSHRKHDVISAVIASATYPFAFLPMPMDKSFLVDGGLSSNLPVFLFEKERANRLPLFAFDLEPVKLTTETRNFGDFFWGIVDTALGSGDLLMRETLGTVQYVSIDTGDKINTLDFMVTKDQRKELFASGKKAATEFFNDHFRQADQVAEPAQVRIEGETVMTFAIPADEELRSIQAVHCPPHLIEHLLSLLRRELGKLVDDDDIRAAVWLPTKESALRIVYHAGTTAADRQLAFAPGAGWIGQTWKQAKPTIVDLLTCPPSDPSWGLGKSQTSELPLDRKAVYSFPIFDPHRFKLDSDPTQDMLIGVLSIDMSLYSSDLEARQEAILDQGLTWADVMAKLLVN